MSLLKVQLSSVTFSWLHSGSPQWNTGGSCAELQLTANFRAT